MNALTRNPSSKAYHSAKEQSGMLYAIAFDNGLLKVGRSEFSVASRLQQHTVVAKRAGGTPVWQHVVSVKCLQNGCEQELIAFCSKLMARPASYGREWFSACEDDFVKIQNHMEYIAQCSIGLEFSCITEKSLQAEILLDRIFDSYAANRIGRAAVAELVGVAKMIQQTATTNMISCDIFHPNAAYGGYSSFVAEMACYFALYGEDAKINFCTFFFANYDDEFGRILADFDRTMALLAVSDPVAKAQFLSALTAGLPMQNEEVAA